MLQVALPRAEVFCPRGMVSTVNPMATSAGFRALIQGGTSIDAAIAAGAVLAVTEPQAGGLGGDVFILHYSAADDTIYALNGNGQAPQRATVAFFQEQGGIPSRGPLTSTVPGAVGGWEAANKRWGRLPLSKLLEDAIFLAEGHPGSHRLQRSISGGAATYSQYESSARILLPGGAPPVPGEIFRQQELAESLREVAETGGESFYRGELAKRIVAGVKANGGIIEVEDMAAYEPQFREPLSVSYGDWQVFGQPLPSQMFITLQALGILDQVPDWAKEFGNPDSVHVMIEAIKLAFSDRYQYLGDPDLVQVPLDYLLSPDRFEEQARLIDRGHARPPARTREGGVAIMDTTCMAAADADGNMTVYIHSLFQGSGVIAGDTGIHMNSRMVGFGLAPDHPNCVAPGKRPVHTLTTWMAREPGGSIIAGGTPGGDKQVQANLQMITDLLNFGADLQSAVAAPRWFVGDGVRVEIEDPLGSAIELDLAGRGHEVKTVPASMLSGRVVVVQKQTSGVLRVGQEPRDGGTFTSAW